ncbi:MAG: hypothetical protein R2789_13045 [Microthrixaceae bacterium]
MFGLLGIVLTLGIMAFLAVKVLGTTPGTGSGLSGAGRPGSARRSRRFCG